MGVGGQHHAPAALPLGKKLVTHYARRWVVPIAGLGVWGKSHPYRDSIPPTVQPAASRCTGYAIPAAYSYCCYLKGEWYYNHRC